jgi:hypothetical protein
MCHGTFRDDWTEKEAELTEMSQEEELERPDVWREAAPEPETTHEREKEPAHA